MSDVDASEKRFSIEVHEDISDTDRRELIRMITHVLDGDPAFAIEDYDLEAGDLDKIETFVNEELRGDADE